VSEQHAQQYFFTPAIRLDELADENARRAAEALVSRTKQQHEVCLSSRLKDIWAEVANALSPELMSGIEDAIYHNWLKKDYFAVLEQIVNDKDLSDQAPGGSGMPPTKEGHQGSANGGFTLAKHAQCSRQFASKRSQSEEKTAGGDSCSGAARPATIPVELGMFSSPRKKQGVPIVAILLADDAHPYGFVAAGS
jgi:hypothetical protein